MTIERVDSGIGLELQRLDSDIAESVILAMKERGYLVLPVHDSLIVEDGRQQELEAIMREFLLLQAQQEL